MPLPLAPPPPPVGLAGASGGAFVVPIAGLKRCAADIEVTSLSEALLEVDVNPRDPRLRPNVAVSKAEAAPAAKGKQKGKSGGGRGGGGTRMVSLEVLLMEAVLESDINAAAHAGGDVVPPTPAELRAAQHAATERLLAGAGVGEGAAVADPFGPPAAPEPLVLPPHAKAKRADATALAARGAARDAAARAWLRGADPQVALRRGAQAAEATKKRRAPPKRQRRGVSGAVLGELKDDDGEDEDVAGARDGAVGMPDLGMGHLHALRSRQRSTQPPAGGARRQLQLRDGVASSRQQLGATISRLSQPSTRPNPFQGVQSTERHHDDRPA